MPSASKRTKQHNDYRQDQYVRTGEIKKMVKNCNKILYCIYTRRKFIKRLLAFVIAFAIHSSYFVGHGRTTTTTAKKTLQPCLCLNKILQRVAENERPLTNTELSQTLPLTFTNPLFYSFLCPFGHSMAKMLHRANVRCGGNGSGQWAPTEAMRTHTHGMGCAQ